MSPLELHVQHVEARKADCRTLVILHGLYGSARSWATVSRRLADSFDVHAFDLRNHGRSPHAEDCSWSAMADDVLATMDSRGMGEVVLLGHSLGGKVAMHLAAHHERRVSALLIADIAPRFYRPDAELLDSLLALDLSRVQKRSDADAALAGSVPDARLRGFLLTNLVRDGDSYAWQCNLEALSASLGEIGSSPLSAEGTYSGVCRFVVGGDSEYWKPGDTELAQQHFPRADVVVIEGSGHNVHVEGGQTFIDAVAPFA